MAITRWDPLRDVVALQSRLNSLFQDYGRGQGEDEALLTGVVDEICAAVLAASHGTETVDAPVRAAE